MDYRSGDKVVSVYTRETKHITMAVSRWRVNLCCWRSTAAIAAVASLPKVAIFDLSSLSFISAASSFKLLSELLFSSLTLAWHLATSMT